MKLPWFNKRAENRAYTEAYIEAAFAAASGETVSGLVASLEIITGWWGRGFQSADIQPAGVVADLLRPHLAVIGRSLVTRGEMVFYIDTDGDAMALLPASNHHVEGNPNPESWQYTLTLTGPTETITRTLGADRVLHLQYAADAAHPWRGVSPIGESATTKGLMSILETRLTEEISGGVGTVIPQPNANAAATLQAQLRNLKGKLALVESTNQAWGSGNQGVPTGDFSPRRLGGAPPEPTVLLRRQVEQSLLASAGVPVTVLDSGDGTASREAFRQFLHLTIQPVALNIAAQIAARFDMDTIEFSFDRLWAADISGRARAFQSMVGGGMEVGKAASLAGLMVSE